MAKDLRNAKQFKGKEDWEIMYEASFEGKHRGKTGFVEVPRAVTVAYDPRFPNTNQTRNCWQNFVDYHRCKNRYSEDKKECKYFKWAYHELCTMDMIEKWNEQIDEGKFVGKLT